MAVAECVRLAPLAELVQRVLADRLEHGEPHVAVEVVADAHEALLRETLESADDVERRRVAGDPADGLRRLDRRATREHAEASEQPLILRVEQVVAPVDRAAQRPLPLRQVAPA